MANEKERTGQGSLFDIEDLVGYSNTELAEVLARIAAAPSGSLHDVHEQGAAYRDWAESAERQRQLTVASAWCAAFMWRKIKDAPPAITHDVFKALKNDENTLLSAAVSAEIARLAAEYGFFHWHLEFPDIFRVGGAATDFNDHTGWTGGFTVLLGNPPWDRLEFEDKKYFSTVEPSIAGLSGSALSAAKTAWLAEDGERDALYRAARRTVKATAMFASNSGAFPLCAKGLAVPGVTKLQVDQLFVEQFTSTTSPDGRSGCIVPSSIATGAGGQILFGSLVERGALNSLYDLVNLGRRFFDIHPGEKFCLLSAVGAASREPAARYAFSLLEVADIDQPGRVFTISPEDAALMSPNTGTPPVFATKRDADLTVAIYRRLQVLSDDGEMGRGSWDIDFKYMVRSANDREALRTRDDLDRDGWQLAGNTFIKGGKRMLPVYEAKMVDFFNHRAADVVKSETAVDRQNQPRYLGVKELDDPNRLVIPMRWLAEEGPVTVQEDGKEKQISGVLDRLLNWKWEREWLCGWCDLTDPRNERTSIPAFLPRVAALNTYPLMFPMVATDLVAGLVAAQSSLVFDFSSRQRVGGIHMAQFIWKQLPVPTPAMLEPHLRFIAPRVLELVYTAYDMTPLARDLGDEGDPFRWDEDRRAQLRAELDAFFFRVYGIDDRDDVDYILETFQTESGGLKHNEIRDHGEYRTKRLVLAEYDRMTAADAAGVPYESPLALPPGLGPRHPAS